jgi:peptide/nickel transport system substrate-binding protein
VSQEIPAFDSFARDLTSPISRRSFLRRAAFTGLTIPAVAGLLAACEADDDEEAPAVEPDDDEPEPDDEDDDEPADEPEPDDDEPDDDSPEADDEVVPDEDTLVVVDGTEPDSLTPMEGTGPFQHPIKAMYDSLVEFDQDLEVQPLLATDWEVSDDGLEWSMSLREGVLFHNGVELTSQDVLATIQHIQDEDVPASRRSSYVFIEDVDTSDPYVARFICSEVQPDFVQLMGDGTPHLINHDHREEVGYDYARDPVGCGPYKFVEWVAGDRIVMERFDDYWGERPGFQNYVFRPIAETSTRVVVIRTGEADFSFNIPPADAEEVDAEDGVSVIAEPGLTVHMIEPKVALGPLSDANVRRALNMAIDKDAIIEQIMHGYAEPLLTPGIPGLMETIEFDPIPYDPEQAQALLAEAGYSDGFQLQDLVYTSGRWPGDDEVVEAVQGYWANIGVQMGIERRDHAGFVDALREDPEDEEHEGLIIMPIRTSLFTDYHIRRMFHTEATLGLTAQRSGYQNEEVDQLLDEIRLELDEDQRLEMWHEVQRLIWEDQPFIFLFHRHNVVAVRDDVDGYEIHPANHLVPREIHRI